MTTKISRVDVALVPQPEAIPQIFYYCSAHSDAVFKCPKCMGSLGGKATLKKHGTAMASKNGKLGGRPRKKKGKKRKAA